MHAQFMYHETASVVDEDCEFTIEIDDHYQLIGKGRQPTIY